MTVKRIPATLQAWLMVYGVLFGLGIVDRLIAWYRARPGAIHVPEEEALWIVGSVMVMAVVFIQRDMDSLPWFARWLAIVAQVAVWVVSVPLIALLFGCSFGASCI